MLDMWDSVLRPWCAARRALPLNCTPRCPAQSAALLGKTLSDGSRPNDFRSTTRLGSQLDAWNGRPSGHGHTSSQGPSRSTTDSDPRCPRRARTDGMAAGPPPSRARPTTHLEHVRNLQLCSEPAPVPPAPPSPRDSCSPPSIARWIFSQGKKQSPNKPEGPQVP